MLAISVLAQGCSGCSCAGDPGDVSPSDATGDGVGGAGGNSETTSTSSSTSSSANGGGGAVWHQGATETVTAGQIVKSARYRMVFTLGQPTQNQAATSSQKYQMQGGLVGANGNPP